MRRRISKENTFPFVRTRIINLSATTRDLDQIPFLPLACPLSVQYMDVDGGGDDDDYGVIERFYYPEAIK